MSLSKWELIHYPSDTDPGRWRLKLRVAEEELDALIGRLPVKAGRPFLTEGDEYDFGLYLTLSGDEAAAALRTILSEECPQGGGGGGPVPGTGASLDSLLDRVAAGIDAVAAGEPVPESSSPEDAPVHARPSPDGASGASARPDRGIMDLQLNQNYTFDEFIIGPNNRFTAAAAKAVADNPGKIYNPFFIYGGVGLGKTHLMHAVGHYVARRDPGLRILYVTTEKFMNEVIDAIRTGKLQEMREHYRQVDLLLVDDIQFLVESESTQEEFFHTFNLLHQSGRQIIVTSDRPPKQLTTLEDRLRSRFEWGLIADIKSPNLETRVAILKKKGETEHLLLADNILLYIASKLKSNIRELEGFLKRINAYASLTGQEVDMALVESVMADLLPEPEEEQEQTPPPPPPAPERAASSPPSPPADPIPAVRPSTKDLAPPPAPSVGIPRPPAAPGAPPPAAPDDDSGLKPVEVGFFFPEGGQAELVTVKDRFREVIRKHRLKFRLEGVFEHCYATAERIDYADFSGMCRTHDVTIAVVLGPAPETGVDGDEFVDQLGEALDEQKVSIQFVPWQELSKDYRYLNLALDITLLKHTT